MKKIIKSCYGYFFETNKTELHLIKQSMENSKAIIFIHGLSGHPHDTWTLIGQSSLPEMIANDFDEFDVYSFSYPTAKLGFGQKHFSRIANLLYTEISSRLTHTEEIYFVVHSMGGLIARQVVIDQIERYNDTFVHRIEGIVYLGVPFAGAAVALLGGTRQSRSLKIFDESLGTLNDKWVRNYYSNDTSKGRPKYKIAERVIYGMGDMVVTPQSAKPSYMTDSFEVDADHRSICKVKRSDTVYQLINQFLQGQNETETEVKENPLVIWAHGWQKQPYAFAADLELDWTEHFDITSVPRILPDQDVWTKKIQSQLEWALQQWGDTKPSHRGRIRLYSKLCLSAALLIGNRFSRTLGATVEVEHYNEIWSTAVQGSDNPAPKSKPGCTPESDAAVVVLSVSNDILPQVENYIKDAQIEHKEIINVLPFNGAGQYSIQSNEQAVSYAIGVKDIMSDLQNKGIKEIHLFINSPFSVAAFVGHYLTAKCFIQLYEFTGEGYTPSCCL